MQSFTGLALMVPEIITGGLSLKTLLLGHFNGKKAWPEWGYEFYLYGKVKSYNYTLLTRRIVMLDLVLKSNTRNFEQSSVKDCFIS